jgi:PAS domain S-box-containing protein
MIKPPTDRVLKILMLEDSVDDVTLVEWELKKAGITFSPHVTSRREGFQKALAEFRPDVIISDHSLPGFNSIEAFRIYKDHEKSTDVSIPFILVTGNVNEEFAIQSLKAGVDDYILKDRLKRLPMAIESAFDKCRIENERRKYLQQMIAREALMSEAEYLAGFGSWDADLRTGKYTWSDATYSIYGFRPGEIEPDYETFLSLVHPEDRESLVQILCRLRERENNGEYQFRIVTRRGEIKHVACRVNIHRDATGAPVRLVGFNLDITQRKRAEQALQREEQKYRSLFYQNPDAVFSIDVSWRFTNVNQAFKDIVALESDMLIGRDFREVLVESELIGIYNDFLSGAATRHRYATTFTNQAGRTFTLDVTVMAIVVDDEVIGVHCVGKNTTKETQLGNLLDQAYRTARIGGWELDLPKNKVRWTSITRELHEVGPEFQPTVQSGLSFYKEGPSRKAISAALQRCIGKGIPWDLELKIVTEKGNERWVRSMGEAEMKGGKCVRLYGTFQDIHERKKAEQLSKDAYEEKVVILESIGDAFFAVDRNWTVTYWNNMAELHLRMPREKILGKNLWDVYADAIPTAFYDQYHKAMEKSIAVHFEEYYSPLSIWVEVNVYPSSTGLSIYFKDITERKQHVSELEHQYKQLREIARIQSHEVRAPLARLMGLVNLINEGMNEEAELPVILERIGISAAELDALIRQIVKQTLPLEPEQNA